MRFSDTFGEHMQMTIDMMRAYCDSFHTAMERKGGCGNHSVNTMVKHFPGGNWGEHLNPFTEGAFSLPGKVGKASTVMPYYTISYGKNQKGRENMGNSYSKYLIGNLLRERLGYDDVVCTDWSITHDMGTTGEEFASKCWSMEP